jgi:hypothetical protein
LINFSYSTFEVLTMGFLSTVLRAASPVHHGGSSLKTADVLQSVDDAITAKSSIDWKVSNSPSVLKTPRTATVKEADRAEAEATRYEHAVSEGVRLMNAEARRQTAHAKLVGGPRRYLGKTAKAHFKISAANRSLAGQLHDLSGQYAQLGHSLDRKQDTTEQKIELTAHKYGAVR